MNTMVALLSDPPLRTDHELAIVVITASIAQNNDGKFIVAASHKVVRMWDIDDRSSVATLRGYQGEDGYVVGSVNPPRLAAPSRRTNRLLLLRHKNLIYAQEPPFLLVASRKEY